MAFKRTAVEKKEERVHKDLDRDNERGEPAAHKAKVLGKKAIPASGKLKSCGHPFGKPCVHDKKKK